MTESGADYEEWLAMVREEDARNREAFTGERPLTVTEFMHRKRWAVTTTEIDPASDEGTFAVNELLKAWAFKQGRKNGHIR